MLIYTVTFLEFLRHAFEKWEMKESEICAGYHNLNRSLGLEVLDEWVFSCIPVGLGYLCQQ